VLNLFMASLRFEKPVLQIARSVGAFVLLETIALMLITYVPELSLFPIQFMTPR